MRVTAFKTNNPPNSIQIWKQWYLTLAASLHLIVWYFLKLRKNQFGLWQGPNDWSRTHPLQRQYPKFKITIKARLTLSPGSRVMLVPIPLVMRGVPAQIFFAVPGDKTWPAEIVWDLVQLTLDHPLQVELELDLLAGRGQMEQEAKCCQRPKRPHQNPIFVVNYVRFSSRLTFREDLSSESLQTITEVCSKYLAPVPWQSPSCVLLLTIDQLKYV